MGTPTAPPSHALSSHARGLVTALVSAALFGAATPVAKDLLVRAPPTVLAGLFYLGAAVALLPAVARRSLRDGRAPLPADRRNRLRLLGAVVFGGIVGPVLMLAGLRSASAASVAIWLNLETTATALLGVWIFREHLGRASWIGNGGVLAAGVLLSLEGGGAAATGGLLVAAAAVCWGLDNNLTALIDGITPVESTFWKGLVAGATNLCLGVAWHGAGSLADAPWLAALAVGGLSYGASIVLYISSAQVVGASRSQMAFATAPLFGIAGSVAWLGEPLGAVQLLAAALMAGSIALLLLDRHEHEHVHEPVEHEHRHRHDDGHHDHDHPGLDPSVTHSHRHRHGRLRHGHPHWPDLHHRHAHGGGRDGGA